MSRAHLEAKVQALLWISSFPELQLSRNESFFKALMVKPSALEIMVKTHFYILMNSLFSDKPELIPFTSKENVHIVDADGQTTVSLALPALGDHNLQQALQTVLTVPGLTLNHQDGVTTVYCVFNDEGLRSV